MTHPSADVAESSLVTRSDVESARPSSSFPATADSGGSGPETHVRRSRMHHLAGAACLGLAIPAAIFSPPISASLILCGVTSIGIGILARQSR